MGAGDAYLQIMSTGGSGMGSKLSTVNNSQWTGDFAGAGITAVTVDFLNSNLVPLDMRIVLFGPNGGRFTSGVADVVPPDGAWHHEVFSLLSSGLTQVTAGDTYAATLGGVSGLMFRHDVTGSSGGTPISATLGIDNVTAATLAINATWNAPRPGKLGNRGQLARGIPQSKGDAANFLGAISAASTVNLNGSRTVGAISFNNVNSYTVAAGSGGSLVLDNGRAAPPSAMAAESISSPRRWC